MKSTTPGHFKETVRVVSLFLVAWASFFPVRSLSAKSHREKNRPVIRVRIYNYAHVLSWDLRDAERHATYLFAMAGVRIEWTVCPKKQPTGRPQPEDFDADFVVRIIPASMAATYDHTPDALGESLVPSGVHEPTPGGTAIVFYERVKDLSSPSGPFFGEVLGDAIAHELGHLLLGSGHSGGGIMRARWTLRDLRLASQGELRFSPGEVVALQRAARSSQQNSSSMLAARR